MLLREALPRFHAEATAAIAAKPDDDIPEGVSRSALLAQLDTLVVSGPCGASDRYGSFRANPAGRIVNQGYAFSFDFDIPSGNVVADLDRNLRITGFEPVSVPAMRDLQSQLDSIYWP
ncbi:MAG TPA: hypothetical protein VIF57_17335 [Polyangia bacterium]|jgi:hypothetical protein